MSANFHNFSDAMLADEIGRLDTIIKSHEEEQKRMKDEFKRRGCSTVRGSHFVVTASESTSSRLDTKRLRADFGDALDEYEIKSSSTRILVKPIAQIAEAAE